jgi:hypothetical protein
MIKASYPNICRRTGFTKLLDENEDYQITIAFSTFLEDILIKKRLYFGVGFFMQKILQST